jgi:peptidoglycan DL-endopeptidase CwlO
VNRRFRPAGAVVLVVAATLVFGALTPPAWATDYPTWSDVENAKKNEAAKRAQIVKIQEIIDGLEADAAALTKSAQMAAEDYNQARDRLDAATAEADRLTEVATTAKANAELSLNRARAVVVELARMGAGDVSAQLMFAPASEADDLLYRLGTMSKLNDSSTELLAQAQLDENVAESTAAQAAVAQQARQQLASDAETALATAKVAAADAQAKVSKQNSVANTLYAQLAALKGTTSQVEKDYQAGLEWEKAQNAVKDPPKPPTGSDDSNDTTTDQPNSAIVDGAIAFAKKQLGEPYVWGAMGPNSWDCSGLTKASYSSVGVYVGTHSSNNQWDYLKSKKKLVPYDELQPGDLLFYSTGGSTTGSKYHVTLYIGDGLMIEAPYPGTNVRTKPVRFGDLVPYAGRPTG